MKKQSLSQLQKQVDNFNKNHFIGDKVKLKLDSGEIKEVTVQHSASILGGHTAVGWFNEVSGCYNLKSIVK